MMAFVHDTSGEGTCACGVQTVSLPAGRLIVHNDSAGRALGLWPIWLAGDPSLVEGEDAAYKALVANGLSLARSAPSIN